MAKPPQAQSGLLVFLLLILGQKQSCADDQELSTGCTSNADRAGPSLPLYEAEVGQTVVMECPVETGDCVREGQRSLYLWEKFLDLYECSGESSKFSSVSRTLSIEVKGPKDGGFYRCYSWCRGDDPRAWIQLNVFPKLEVPQDRLGVHSGEAFHLRCQASGYPRPTVLLWSATEDVRTREDLNKLAQELEVVDKYTVSTYLRVDKAYSSMSGTYECSVYLSNDLGNSNEERDPLAATVSRVTANMEGFKVLDLFYVPVLVYDPVKLKPGDNVHTDLGKPAALQCQVTSSDERLWFDVQWSHVNGAIVIPCKGSPKYQLSATPPVYSLVIDQVEEKDAGLYECKVTSVFSENEASGTVELILADGYQDPEPTEESSYMLLPWLPWLLLPLSSLYGLILLVGVYCLAQERGQSANRERGTSTEVRWGVEQIPTSSNRRCNQTSQTSIPPATQRRKPAGQQTEHAESLSLEAFADKHCFRLTRP